MIARFARVENTVESSESVRSVATRVPPAMVSSVVAGADSQKVTAARAGVGGSIRRPIRSRNLR